MSISQDHKEQMRAAFLTIFDHTDLGEWDEALTTWIKYVSLSDKFLPEGKRWAPIPQPEEYKTAKFRALLDVCVLPVRLRWDLESLARQFPVKLDPHVEGEAYAKLWMRGYKLLGKTEEELIDQSLHFLQTMSIKSKAIQAAQVVAEQEEKRKAFRNESRSFRKAAAAVWGKGKTLVKPVAPTITPEEEAILAWSRLTEKEKRAEYKKLFK